MTFTNGNEGTFTKGVVKECIIVDLQGIRKIRIPGGDLSKDSVMSYNSSPYPCDLFSPMLACKRFNLMLIFSSLGVNNGCSSLVEHRKMLHRKMLLGPPNWKRSMIALRTPSSYFPKNHHCPQLNKNPGRGLTVNQGSVYILPSPEKHSVLLPMKRRLRNDVLQLLTNSMVFVKACGYVPS